jgi:hypothetical protein
MKRFLRKLRVPVVAFVVLALISGWNSYRAEEAIHLARTVDHRGDIRTCHIANLLNAQTNDRNAVLEKTAKLVVDALGVIQAAPHSAGDTTSIELAKLARKARRHQTHFARIKKTDCEKTFPTP